MRFLDRNGPAVLNQVLEMAKGLGLDLSALFGDVGIGTDDTMTTAGNGATPLPPVSTGGSSCPVGRRSDRRPIRTPATAGTTDGQSREAVG